MDWKTSVKSFVDIFANLDFRNGPLFYVIGIVIAGYCLLAVFIAGLAMKMTRPVLVCLTAVVGGFAAINFLVALIPVFPYELELPDPSSPVWLFAKEHTDENKA